LAHPAPLVKLASVKKTLTVRRATPADAGDIGRLFDLYRQFYEQPADAALARRFVGERLERAESVVFLAEQDGAAVGFTQLYPTFCSVSAAPIFVLYDLFVTPGARRTGAARALMQVAADHAAKAGAVRLELATAKTNHAAQALYRSLGWTRDDVFDHYSLPIG
jgi:ribosomal protein S18 acetylase RimI-like enzyme